MFNEADKTVLLLGENLKLQQDDLHSVYIYRCNVMVMVPMTLNKAKSGESFVNSYNM